MSKRRIIIPKGLVENPEQNSIIEVSSRFSESRGDLIARRQGTKLVAQQLPDWEDSLSSPQEARESQNTFIASTPGCPTLARDDETYYSNALSTTNNSNYYSQNATEATEYLSARSGDSTAKTCYRSALQPTPSSARIDITTNDLSLSSHIESNIEMTDGMLANILDDTGKSLSSARGHTYKPKKLFASNDDTSDEYVLKPPRKLPTRASKPSYGSADSSTFSRYSSDGYWGSSPSQGQQSPLMNQTYPFARPRSRRTNQTYPMAANEVALGESCPCSPDSTEDSGFIDSNISYGGFHPGLASSRIAAVNQTFAPPGGQAYNATFAGSPANQTYPGSYRSPATSRIPPGSPQTLPQVSKRGGRSRPGQDTFPRSANRSLLGTSSSTRSPCSPPRDLPTDESYDLRFQPWQTSSMKPMSYMEEDSLEVDMYVDSHVSPGKYNVITPMTPSPPRGGSGSCSASCPQSTPPNRTFAGAAANRTMPRSGGQSFTRPANQTFAGSPPRMPANQTYAGGSSPAPCPASQTFPGNVSQRYPSSPGSRIPPTSPQTLPRAVGRSRRPRPGQDTFPRSANRSTLNDSSFGSSCPCSPSSFSGSRDRPSDESYDMRFQPWQSSTMRSMSDETEDSLEIDMYVDTHVSPGKYNVITPMTPSPPKGGSGSCSALCSQSTPPNQTFAGAAANRTMPRSGGQRFTRPANQTFAGSPPRMPANQTYAGGSSPAACPASQTFPGNVSQRYPSSPGSRIPPTSPQTLPRAVGRSRRPRPGQDTFPRSANRSTLNDDSFGSSCPCSPSSFSGSRDRPSDESYDMRFQPWQSSTMRSMSDETEDSLEIDMYVDTHVSPGKYNVITPMTPSPPKGGSGSCSALCSQSTPPNQTFAGAAANRTMPRSGGQSFTRPANQTFAGSPPRMPANQTYAGGSSPAACPASQTFPRNVSQRYPSSLAGSRMPPTSPQTLPRAVGRSRRPRPGQDTFPRSANRSTLNDSSFESSCPCSPLSFSGSRDLPSDESYEAGFQPGHTSTMRSMSSMEDSSEDALFCLGAPASRSQQGKYNIISPMTPSPEKPECACAPDGGESVVSYASRTFEESYEEN